MLAVLVLVILSITYGVYVYTFAADKRRESNDEFPDYAGYEYMAEGFNKRIHEIQKVPYQKVSIISRDGLPLCGKYYEAAEGAPIVIMFHGYRSSAIRDGIGIFRFCQEEGYNILLVDQRAHGESGGKTITFGVKERYDCLDWVNHVAAHFGKETKIIIMGLSMGAATVLMATDLGLPENVKGVIGDCGFSTPKDILCSTMRSMKLPVGPTYFFAKMGARLFGGFDLEGASAKESLAKCKIPVLLIHGEADKIVPCHMSYENYEACASEKDILTVPEADHAMSYFFNREEYTKRVKGFMKKYFYV